jgi:hypothetical protein
MADSQSNYASSVAPSSYAAPNAKKGNFKEIVVPNNPNLKPITDN